MVLPWFYHGFTMVLPWFYHGFTMVLPWFYHGFTMVLPIKHDENLGVTMKNDGILCD